MNQGPTTRTYDHKGTARARAIEPSSHQSTQMSGTQVIDPLLNYSDIVDNTCRVWSRTKNTFGTGSEQLQVQHLRAYAQLRAVQPEQQLKIHVKHGHSILPIFSCA